jgi:glycosyltransferase involved in cell wall biosynthesis
MSGDKLKLSVIIITYNEEKNIRACLESVTWADEIIVVDSNSTDKTVMIAKEYTDKVFQQQDVNAGFGEKKQYALSKATGEWVLNIDADERVTPELKHEILQVISNDKNNRYNGYKINIRLIFMGHMMRFGGTYPDYHLRLFKKDKAKFDTKPVHEGIILKGKSGRLKYDILHYSYPDLTTYFNKFNIYTSLVARYKFSQNKRTRVSYVVLRLPCEFIYRYIIKLGFLDGYYGFLYAVISSFYGFIKYAKLYELQHEHTTNN